MDTLSELKTELDEPELAASLPRVGLGLVFVLFGGWEIINPVYWQAYVPVFLKGFHVLTLVKLHGLVLLVTGVGINLEKYRKEFAVLGLLIMLEIVISVAADSGINGVLIRDLGLLFVAAGIMFQGPE